jgi:hypothetical protein
VSALRRLTRSYVQRLVAAPERVMPLLTAARENEWAAVFQPRILHEGEPPGGLRGLFVTGEGAEETLWTMTDYDPAAGHVAYFRTIPGVIGVHIDIRLEGDGAAGCRATVSYTYAALGAEGNARVEAMTEERYREQMVEWARAINHYLETGERLGNY